MIKEIEGIIISEINYGETSKIVNILTEEGIIGIIAKGARSLKSPLRSYVQKFTYGIFNIYYKKDKLSILKSVDVTNNFGTIKTDIILIGYMSYISDLAHQTMKQNTDKEFYNLYINTILKIESGLNPMIICNIFEIKALDYLGVGINLSSCAKCGTTKNLITLDADDGGYICSTCFSNHMQYNEKVMKMLKMYYLVDMKSIKELKISNQVIISINDFLARYYDRYTGLYLKSKKFLETIRK